MISGVTNSSHNLQLVRVNLVTAWVLTVHHRQGIRKRHTADLSSTVHQLTI